MSNSITLIVAVLPTDQAALAYTNRVFVSKRTFNDIAMVESWLVTGPSDKAYELGYTKQQVPIGSWMAGYQVLDTKEGDMIWNDFIKTGKVKGFSVEGEFMLKFSRIDKDEILLSQIIDILSQYNPVD